MRGAMPALPQYALMARYSVKNAQGQLYLTLPSPSQSAIRFGSSWSALGPKSDSTISSLVFQRFSFLVDGIAEPVYVFDILSFFLNATFIK
jgi:hypothetical protein